MTEGKAAYTAWIQTLDTGRILSRASLLRRGPDGDITRILRMSHNFKVTHFWNSPFDHFRTQLITGN